MVNTLRACISRLSSEPKVMSRSYHPWSWLIFVASGWNPDVTFNVCKWSDCRVWGHQEFNTHLSSFNLAQKMHPLEIFSGKSGKHFAFYNFALEHFSKKFKTDQLFTKNKTRGMQPPKSPPHPLYACSHFLTERILYHNLQMYIPSDFCSSKMKGTH